jgi:hypothetical protein
LSAVQSALQPGETLVHETRANLGRGLTAQQGRLTLTDRRLVFEPLHLASTQQIIVIPVEEIASAERIWLPGPFGLRVVRALQVLRSNGDRMTFMVQRPARWSQTLAPRIRS